MRKSISKTGSWINRFGGRLFYRVVGSVTALATIGSAWLAWQALSAGELVGGVLAAAFAAMMGFITRYCWSPDRRLTDIDP